MPPWGPQSRNVITKFFPESSQSVFSDITKQRSFPTKGIGFTTNLALFFFSGLSLLGWEEVDVTSPTWIFGEIQGREPHKQRDKKPVQARSEIYCLILSSRKERFFVLKKLLAYICPLDFWTFPSLLYKNNLLINFVPVRKKWTSSEL